MDMEPGSPLRRGRTALDCRLQEAPSPTAEGRSGERPARSRPPTLRGSLPASPATLAPSEPDPSC